MRKIVPLSGPEITIITVAECGEPLVDVCAVGALRVDRRLADPAGAFAMLRRSVVDRLVTAQTLLPPELRLLLIEGFRPAETHVHVTGAAADLTLCTVDGEEISMGTSVNDTSTELCHTDAEGLSPIDNRHRQILATALRAAGLVNYPAQWWHWSYGDRYWAHIAGHRHAIYGSAEALYR